VSCVSTLADRSFSWNDRHDPMRPTRPRPVSLRRATSPTLLWIDDFEPGLILYRKMFEDLGFKVLTATSGDAGVQLAAMNRVDAVVTDYEMPGMDGVAVASSIKALDPRTPVLLFSGSTLVPAHARSVVDAICDKARPRTELLAAIHRLLQRKPSLGLQPPAVAQASHHGHRTVA
jgi:CheY-like chemotaxis protein